MKRKIFLCSAMSLMFITSFASNIKAESNIVMLDEFNVLYRVNGHETYVTRMKLNNEYVYCVEADKSLFNNEIMKEDGANDKMNQLSNIGRIGIDLMNKYNDRKYYYAAQVLIWEKLGYNGKLFNFNDYVSYRRKVLSEYDCFIKKYADKKIDLYNEEQRVTLPLDKGLNNLEYDKEYFEVNNDTLKIKKNFNGIKQIKVSYTKDNINKPVLYSGLYNKDAQRVVKCVYTQNPSYLIKIGNNIKKQLTVTKLGESIKGFKKLVGCKFKVIADEDIKTVFNKILYKKGETVKEFLTGNDDYRIKLPLGKYKIVETKCPTNYKLNKKKFDVVLTDNKKVVIRNYLNKVFLKFKKVLERGGDYSKVKFNLVKVNNKNERIIRTIQLDTYGNYQGWFNLEKGRYYLQEVNTDDYHVLNKTKYYFNHYEDSEVDLKVINNKLIIKRKPVKIEKVNDRKKVLKKQIFNKLKKSNNEKKEINRKVVKTFDRSNIIFLISLFSISLFFISKTIKKIVNK